MDRLRVCIGMAAACVGILAGASAQTITPAATSGKVELRMTLEEYLRRSGVSADVYFTVEVVGGQTAAFTLLGTEGDFDVSARTGDEVARAIERGISGVSVVRSKCADVVYHLYGPGTKPGDETWLDKKITLTFAGPLAEVFEPLAKACAGDVAEFEQFGVFGSNIPQPDYITPIAVDARDESVRDVVTCCLPFSQRDRILWTCTTRNDLHRHVELLFGAKAYQAKDEPTGELLPFDRGELSCRDNPASPVGVEAAAAYIAKQMREKAPLQVRWAMLYLGKQRAEAQMPLLFDHLGYRYVKCGLVEEQYPALRALSMFGKAALEEALKRLKSEQDPTKLALLRQLVSCIAGKDKAVTLVKDQVLAQVSAEQQARIDKAVTVLGPTTLPAENAK
jgi:hypothetical protein